MRKIALLAVGVLAALAVTAGPAAGGSGFAQGAAACRAIQVDGSEVFDGLRSLLVAGSAARGTGSLAGREPTLNEKLESLPASAKGKGGKGFRATVPVWFHVISDGTTGNVTAKQIDAHLNFVSKLTDCDGESAETDSSLDFARDCEYITPVVHEELTAANREVGRLLGAMIKDPGPWLIH